MSLIKNADNFVRGSLDESFGVAGMVYLQDPISQSRLQAHAVFVMPDLSLLCAASSEENQTTYLVMLDPLGVVDTSFGDAGISKFKLSDVFPGSNFAQPYSVKFDAHLKRFVIGFFVGYGGDIRSTGLARFDLNGALDKSFGNSGVFLWNSDARKKNDGEAVAGEAVSTTQDYYGEMLVLDSDGFLILTTLIGAFGNQASLVKVTNSGVLDETFGDKGVIHLYRRGEAVRGEDLILQDGKFLVAATTRLHTDGGWFIGRFGVNGELDETFATDGYYVEGNVINGLLTRDDKPGFHIVGTSANLAGQHLFLTLQRRGVNGEEDPHFGSIGWVGVLHDAYAWETVVWKSAAYNPGSNIVVVGHISARGEVPRTVIASIEQDMGMDVGFGDNGRLSIGEDAVVHELIIQEADRKIVYISSQNRQPDSFVIVRLHG